MVNTAATDPIPSAWFTVQDVNGANDVPAQSDLTQMGRTTSTTSYNLFWSWDSIDQWTGSGQTGDACALFDYQSPGDGKVDAVVCGQVTNPAGDPTKVVQNHAPYVFRCDNSRVDRCGQPSAAQQYPATVLKAGPLSQAELVTDPAGKGNQSNLVTRTDPFDASSLNGPGSNYDYDATLEVDVTTDYLKSLAAKLGQKYPLIPSPDPTLVNVCSYPSAGNGGNNNPFDCIASPGSGFLKITKNSGSTTGSFDFNVSPVPTGQTNPITVNTTGTPTATGATGSLGMPFGNSNNISEASSSLWNVTSLACTLESGTSTGTASTSARTVTGFRVESGKLTTCAYTNSRALGYLVVEKQDPAGNALPGATFTAGGVAMTKIGATDTGYYCRDGLVVGNSYAVVETVAPTGYNRDTTTYNPTVSSSGSCPTSTAGVSVDKAVTDNPAPGAIKVSKTKDGGIPFAGVEFKLYSDTPTVGIWDSGDVLRATATTDGNGDITFSSLPPGPYCVVETVPNGYTGTPTTRCTTVALGGAAETGQTVNLAFTNTAVLGTVTLTKVDGDGNAMAGVTFTLYKSADLTYDENVDTVPQASGPTGSDGRLSFTDVPFGDYCLVETVPAGYSGFAPSCFNLALGTAPNTGPTKAFGNIVNTAVLGTVTLTKVDDAGAAMGNVTFTLYKSSDLTYDSGVDTTVQATDATANDGTLTFGNVPFGNYCLVESVPTGYSGFATQCFNLSLGTSAANLGPVKAFGTITNNRKHIVSVIVCHEGTNTLVSTPVKVGGDTVNSMTKAQADAAHLSESALCSLPGATFTHLGDSDFTPTITLGTHATS